MFELRWHGRGGQGAVTGARIIGRGASVYEGKYAQSFPSFGTERRGAPMVAFTRLDDKPVRVRTQIYEPNAVIVLDDTLVEAVDVTKGLNQDGFVLLNTDKKPGDFAFSERFKTYTVDATSLALEVLGSPIVNTAIVGAFAKVSPLVSFDSALKAIGDTFSGELGEKNRKLAQLTYDKLEVDNGEN